MDRFAPQRFVDRFLVDVDFAGQRFGDNYMGIDRFEVEVIRKDNSMDRSHAHVHGMSVRTANGDHAFACGEQFVPTLYCLRDGMMPDELREEGMKCSVE